MTIQDGLAIAARHRRKLQEAEYNQAAIRLQAEQPSDPFVYGRVMARLRSGAMKLEDYHKENGTVST